MPKATTPKPKKAAKPRASARSRKGGPGGKRITDAELLYRLRVVEQALIDGKRGGEILDVLKNEHSRDVPYSTVASYMQRVRDKWEQEDAMLRPLWRERQLRKLHDVAATLEGKSEWGNWVKVQRLIADLEGNLAPVKVEHSQADPFEGWSLDELRRFIDTKGKEVPQRARGESGGAGNGGTVWPTSPVEGSSSVH